MIMLLAVITLETHLTAETLLPWVPEVFSRVRWGASSAAGRHFFGQRLKRKNFSRGSLFKTWPKPETAHEKPPALRVRRYSRQGKNRMHKCKQDWTKNRVFSKTTTTKKTKHWLFPVFSNWIGQKCVPVKLYCVLFLHWTNLTNAT